MKMKSYIGLILHFDFLRNQTIGYFESVFVTVDQINCITPLYICFVFVTKHHNQEYVGTFHEVRLVTTSLHFELAMLIQF